MLRPNNTARANAFEWDRSGASARAWGQCATGSGRVAWRTRDIRFRLLVIGPGFGGSVSALRWPKKATGRRVRVRAALRRQGLRRDHLAARSFPVGAGTGPEGDPSSVAVQGRFAASGSAVGGGRRTSMPAPCTAPSPNSSATPVGRARAVGAGPGPALRHAERMLGVQTVPFDSVNQRLDPRHGAGTSAPKTASAARLAASSSANRARRSAIPISTARVHAHGVHECGACMVGCRVGAKNTLLKNYLWFAEKRGPSSCRNTK